MGLRVGIIYRKIKHSNTLAWGENEALDDNGQGLGPCFRPAEKKLRQQMD